MPGEYFRVHAPHGARLSGVCIDGDHESPWPVNDARNAHEWLEMRGLVVFHDAKGQPVIDGVEWLHGQGYKIKHYPTTHGVTVCWRSPWFTPTEF